MNEPTRRWRPILVRVALGMGVLLLGGAVYLGLLLYPWLRGPEEPPKAIEARWAKVETWAQVDVTRDNADPDALDNIAVVLRTFEPPRSAGSVPVVDEARLTPEQRSALEQLARWEQNGAPMPDRSCARHESPKVSSLQLFRVGQTALYSAAGAEQLPSVKAVLALARRMRQRGALVDLAIGAELAVQAARWSRDRKVPFPKEFSTFRPRVPEIHATLAREAVCIVDLVERGDGTETLGTHPDAPPFGLIRIERELAVYKDHHGRLLEQAHDKREDWPEMVRLYERAAERKPRSLLLDAAAVHSNVIRSTGEKFDRYATILGAP
jgi:hypothetical protein